MKGTRLSVGYAVHLLAEGWTGQAIADRYPVPTAEDIRACLHYAGERLREDKARLLRA